MVDPHVVESSAGGDILADEVEGTVRDKQVETNSRLVKTTGLVVIIVVALLMILGELGINIGPILASVGIVSLAVGLGAQTLVKDVIGGLFIIFFLDPYGQLHLLLPR